MGRMDWSAPQNKIHRANYLDFLSKMANYMNKRSPYITWDVDKINAWFSGMENLFYQTNDRSWRFDEVPTSWWERLFQVYDLLGNDLLPRLHRIDPKARIFVMNGYRTASKQAALSKGSTTKKKKKTKPSEHTLFAATDVTVLPASLIPEAKYIMDRLFVSSGRRIQHMGLGLYDPGKAGNFMHVDSRSFTSRDHTWFGNVNNGHGEVSRNGAIGVLLYSEFKAGVTASPVPPRAATLGLPPPSGAVVPNFLPPGLAMDGLSDGGGSDAPESLGEIASIVHDDGQPGILEIAGVGLADYLTPEERRKGIIGERYTLDDWHLVQLVGPQSNMDAMTGLATGTIKQVGAKVFAAVEQGNPSTGLAAVAGALRADLSDDPRRRYVQSLVEAEFWNRRYRGRSLPQVSGRFNPYIVSGFPALVLLPDRPVIAEITSFTHTISLSTPSASTTAALGAPRYWDEGEPWYFLGGWGEADHGSLGALFRRYWRRFPYWHNQYAMPTNSWVDKARTVKRKTPLDRFYQNLLGCDAIEYQSNSAWKFRNGDNYQYELAQRVIRDRDRTGIEVNPDTLDIREYNAAIAELDEDGRFAKGTLAYKFWGAAKPYDPPEVQHGRDVDSDSYTERYGVSENELLEDFLGNKLTNHRGRAVLTGPTFGGVESASRVTAAQRRIIEYLEDLDGRSLGGGNG